MPRTSTGGGSVTGTAVLLAALALIGAACGSSETASKETATAQAPAAAVSTAAPSVAAQPRTFMDVSGKSFTVEQPPKRVVALSPSVVELLYAVGSPPIARPSSATYPEAAKALPSIGTSYQPNLEQIVAQTPDFIVADAQIQGPQTVAELAKFGVPVFRVRVQSVADVTASLRLLGDVMGRSEEGERAAKDLEAKLENVQRRLPSESERPSVFLMVGTADAFWGAKP